MIRPVELQVLTGALRAICEEMGAVLIRSAHSANIKERRDASTALFDPRGEMVMQAEHIPVHLGAMPAAVAAVLDEQHAPEPLVDPQRPLPRRHPPARHHGDHARVRRRRADRLRGQTAPTTPTSAARRPGSMPADSRTLADEGVVIEPRVLDEAAIAELSRPDAPARPAPRRPARAAGRRPGRRSDACASCASASAPARCARRSPRCSTTPSGAPAPASRSSRTATRTADDVLEAREGDLEIVLQATVAGDALTLDFTGTRRAARGQPQLPAGGDPLGVLLRRPGAHRSRHPRQRRRLPADRGDRARGHPAQRRAPRRPSSAATSRPRRGSPTSCWPPSAAPSGRER